jgi:LmbE family N-acetylglucosaminyl deacetylase
VSGGVLAVFAHPDDESIFAGGTLAACAAAGLEVGVVSLTHGELSGPGRERELAAAAEELGIAWAECLDYPDGELACTDGAADAVAGRLRDSEPAAVISFGEEGLYWHPDHIACHAIVTRAISELGLDAHRYAVIWPLGLASGLVAAMTERGLPADLWGLDPDGFGIEQDVIDVRLDVSRFIGAKLRAIASHHTQIDGGHVLHELPADLARKYLGHEYFSGDDPEWLERVVASG